MSDKAQTMMVEAKGWRPNPGDRVAGKVVDVSATDGGYGVYPIVTIETKDGGVVAVHAFHTVLRRELAKRKPKPGDDLDITYVGKKTDGGGYGKGYDVYRVAGGTTPGYDWSRDLPQEASYDAASAADDLPVDTTDLPERQIDEEPAGIGPADDGGDLPF